MLPSAPGAPAAPLLANYCVSVLAAVMPCTAGADAPEQTPGAESAPQRVEITAGARPDDRKESLGAKRVITRDEIQRFKDTLLGDVLARVPGISISGGKDQSREVRLRGLAAGYTLVLVNGERVPPGFSVDSISPDLVERIEILRSTTAETTGESIAGAINIVLRRQSADAGLQIGGSTTRYADMTSVAFNTLASGRTADTTYSVATSFASGRDRWPTRTRLESTDRAAGSSSAYLLESLGRASVQSAGLVPQLRWRRDDALTFDWEGNLHYQRRDYRADEQREALAGASPPFASDRVRNLTHTLDLRTSGTLKLQATESTRLEAKLTLGSNSRESEGELDALANSGATAMFRKVDATLSDRSSRFFMKLTHAASDTTSWSLGADLQRNRRQEGRVQQERSDTGFPTIDLDEAYAALVTRRALFFQGEWAPSSRLRSSFGIRTEWLGTSIESRDAPGVGQRRSLASPILQLEVSPHDFQLEKFRAAVSRTYKSPSARDLIPRRWVVNDNSANSPNFQGNPALLPEDSWGLELGYEKYFASTGILAINAYAREISNVVLQRVYRDPQGVWIVIPANEGKAHLQGLELEAKVPTRALESIRIPLAELRLTLARHLSRIDSVPGPDNRLGDQPAWALSLGVDLRSNQSPLSATASYSYTASSKARLASERRTESVSRRSLDVALNWQLDANSGLSVAAVNIVKSNVTGFSVYDDGVLMQRQDEYAKTFSKVRVAYKALFR